ncbi:hypothetical protein OPQ81_004931 [Rhizoctonia solani]|nr:hypothetical protein OPQ81_004931 [Rhizoctonia solani]
MSSISALLNVASSSHSSNEHDLPSLTSLSTALLNYSSSEYPTRYSDSPPSYSPPHSRESNSPSSQAYYGSYSSASSSYLPTPASSVRNLPLSTSSANGSPSYTADNSFSYPSPRSDTAVIGPSYLAQASESTCYPYSMSRASAPMINPLHPQHQQSWGMPPPPVPAPVDEKDIAKPDLSSAPASPGNSAAAPAPATTTAAQKAKKKHVCQTCSRPFSTSGHLARHTRVHTGERNHKCPFPGCETRCSRQDNLQQHYRIHLSPKSRRTSNSAATRAAIARAIESAVHEDMANNGIHATHPPAHPHPYPAPYPPPHYPPAAPYGAYPQYPPPNGSTVHPGQPQFMPAPGQPHPIHYPYPPPMTYAYPPPAPGQLPVHAQGAPQAPPPGHHVPNGHHPQYAPYPPQRPPSSANGYPPQSGQQTPMGAPVQSAATSRAASTSGSNSPVQQSPRNTQPVALPTANALGLQNGVPPTPASAKPGPAQGWSVDQHGQPIGPDGRPHYANSAYAYPSPYPSEAGGPQPLPNTMPPSNQRPRPGAGMPSPQSPGRAMNGNASGPPTPSAYAPQQVIQLEPTAQGQGDGRSPPHDAAAHQLPLPSGWD